jgi:hypothetical protein
MAFIQKYTLKLTKSQVDATLRTLQFGYQKASKADQTELREVIADLATGGIPENGNRSRAEYQRQYRAKKAKETKAPTKSAGKKKVAKKKATKKNPEESK